MSSHYVFKLVEAQFTQNYKHSSKTSSYCSFKVGNKRVLSKVGCNNKKSLTWSDFPIVVQTPGNAVEVSFKDKIKYLPDEKIASFIIALDEIKSQKRITKWYVMHDRYQQAVGKILVSGEYQGSGVDSLFAVDEGYSVHHTEQANNQQDDSQEYAQHVVHEHGVHIEVDHHWDDDFKMNLLNKAY